MRFWKILMPISSMPTSSRALWWWIGAKVFWWMGGPTILISLVLVLTAVPMLDFMVGDFSGTGTGDIKDGHIRLSSGAVAKNEALSSVYDSVAGAWQLGLTPVQIKAVKDAKVNLPGAVLLAMQKMLDDFTNPDPTGLYQQLQPTYVWQTFRLTTSVYKRVSFFDKETQRHGRVRRVHLSACQVTNQTTVRTVLTHALTWDGTLTTRYRVVTTGQKSCVGSFIHVVHTHLRRIGVVRTYTWSRVWHAFAQMAKQHSKDDFVISDSQASRDLLASLIAMQDPSVSDPYVQAMVRSLGIFRLPGDLAMSTADGNVVRDVLRFKTDIQVDAAKYRVPAAFVAAVIAQESGGREHRSNGLVLSSGVGSGGIGALGLMQVEPSTASQMVLDGVMIGDQAVDDLSNATINIDIGTKYLAALYHAYGRSIVESASAYNAGPGAEIKARSEGDSIVQNPQTLAYVSRITNLWLPLFEKDFSSGLPAK